MPRSSNGASNICWTWNNPTKTHEQALEHFKEIPTCRFLVFQEEEGTDGTRHFQGYVEFARQHRWCRINRGLPEGEHIHCESRRGTQEGAIAYCSKEDTRVAGPWQWGTPKEQRGGSKADLEDFVARVKGGATKRDLLEEHSSIMSRYRHFYSDIRGMHMPELRSEQPLVELSIGGTGIGKTRRIMDEFAADPSFYVSPLGGSGFWMDGYDGQSVVLLDDFAGGKSKIGLTELLRLLDRYPVQVPVKGSFVWWYPEKIFVTTNLHPRLWYEWTKREEQYFALMRRFTQVRKDLRLLNHTERTAFVLESPHLQSVPLNRSSPFEERFH